MVITIIMKMARTMTITALMIIICTTMMMMMMVLLVFLSFDTT